jgi:hypothetical protein
VTDRVLFFDGGGTLTSLLDGAKSTVTVNSTAAQQALWRGLPVAALGRAVYAKPGLVSGQRLDRFFADPQRPNQQAYWVFRKFLLETSQFEGSLYSRSGIATLLDTLLAAMLEPVDPYLLDLTKPGGMFLAREFIMRDGDTLYVTSAPFTKLVKILQSVAPLVTFAGSARALSTF